MKPLEIAKYVINSASYGVILAVVLLILVPELRENNNWNIFEKSSAEQAPLSYAKAVRRAGPAVVNLYSEEIQNNPTYYRTPRRITRLGSGVIMQANGYMLTNYHVVQNAAQVRVDLQNGQSFPADIIGYDVFTDLAVLKIEADNLPVIPQDAKQQSQAGDIVLAIGNPLDLGQTITQGIISATGRTAGLRTTNYLDFLQMDAAINEGNSGGALVDTNGTLVGINSRRFRELNPQLDVQGIFFAIPYQLANKIMLQIIEHGRVIRGWLGIDSRAYNQNAKGFLIHDVTPDSPAEKAGLQRQDIVYKIGDTPIDSIVQALDLVAETTPGTELIFYLYRDQKPMQLTITIEERPNN